ncbi:MAG: 2-amino-4-hydroxy-6-hydroxymethyldihydropteridine diphosphokinase [Planctomycetaceae bacterium]|jgi:2-amino-4-hydroxy-6-hydroxymethyldihydropteridine diphosphokinase|nr:2-amino-4-hydroxy-6-hydroxymethyldihydropteridine diphosphokinase [Planctomycetaceae bacterium]
MPVNGYGDSKPDEVKMTEVLLGLGSNLGNRQETLEQAWKEIGGLPETQTLRLSRFYQTEPVGGPPGQPEFLNAVGVIETRLPAQILLEQLQEIELRLGRVRKEHWGARTLDIDILLYGNQIIATPTLTVPHPEMLLRRFVLEPAQEVAAGSVHPETGLTLREHDRIAKQSGKGTSKNRD